MRQEIKERIDKIKKGQVPNGYEKKMNHIYPKEWKIKIVGDFIKSLNSGISINTDGEKANEDEKAILKLSAIGSNIFRPEENKKVNLKDVSKIKESVKADNILIIRKNTPELVGNMCFVNRDYHNLFLPDLIWQSEFKKNALINRKFLNEILNTDHMKYIIKKLATGTSQSMKNITKENFLDIGIVIPNELEEQNYLVDILSTWDTAIEKQEKIIELKKEQKKWLMQQLLTGKKRLKGFSGEERKTKLKEHIIQISVKNKNNSVTRILSVTNNRGFINQSEQFDRQVASKDTSSYKIIRKNQFGYNPSRVNVGSIDLLRDFEEGILSPIYVIFEPNKNKIFLDYLFQFIKSPNFYGQMRNLLQGSVRDNLSFDSLSEIKLFIPPIQEQKAIAEILSTADKEIDLLEKELEAIKEQKKGLMQLLLTGIVRV